MSWYYGQDCSSLLDQTLFKYGLKSLSFFNNCKKDIKWLVLMTFFDLHFKLVCHVFSIEFIVDEFEYQLLHILHSCFTLSFLFVLPSSTGSVVRRSCGMHTGEPEPQRRHQPSSNVMPSVSPSAKQSWNAYSCQSSWTAAYLLIPPFPAHPSLSPSPCPPPQQLQTPSTWTPMDP